ncbi:MAG TPA: hypothetical protein DDX89_04740 [Candidatus Omnitrophica bacterium]|nr:MAG: hypothetical protein A2Z92_03235 [Omnitrophica WOR_2 bacterium GWA2_63_20]OGX17967.1 MAG: hypothetical protein A2105_04050 [Omnitrophica WOR_2 bacterium GWF2_63_9]OGX31453.1 MAG: hypothetical protein A3E56_00020 [Omnitrophica WOR_2 bacterium RIFCSPHIGHO2_12_FULL_64_13]OGX36371.1 MAG: hypothetical protein A3B73_00935 [Omnitrophica WOR_2 bacterium RIFCSPHIGHO2_02_FULL_63_39]OGX44521.1 MAG: hypothetical protein A3I71_02785 [Omnitrophica WOR_2 bacterium RIFCSPLOWO2_02_FULL_63_16]OGX50129.1
MRLDFAKLEVTFVLALGMFAGPLAAQEPPAEAPAESWLQPYPIPADPELEEQIVEIQQALSAINRELVRRNEAVEKTADAAEKTRLYGELDLLRKEHRSLEGLLNDLVDEAKASERTEIDEALARARWLERQQEQWYQKEEQLRDRQ